MDNSTYKIVDGQNGETIDVAMTLEMALVFITGYKNYFRNELDLRIVEIVPETRAADDRY